MAQREDIDEILRQRMQQARAEDYKERTAQTSAVQGLGKAAATEAAQRTAKKSVAKALAGAGARFAGARALGRLVGGPIGATMIESYNALSALSDASKPITSARFLALHQGPMKKLPPSLSELLTDEEKETLRAEGALIDRGGSNQRRSPQKGSKSPNYSRGR